jgi:hypothetical protein
MERQGKNFPRIFQQVASPLTVRSEISISPTNTNTNLLIEHTKHKEMLFREKLKERIVELEVTYVTNILYLMPFISEQ